jgi:hypothetical protein
LWLPGAIFEWFEPSGDRSRLTANHPAAIIAPANGAGQDVADFNFGLKVNLYRQAC